MTEPHASRRAGVELPAWDFEVRRDDLRIHELRGTALPSPTLEDQALLSVDALALSANNLTYAVTGVRLGYWQLFLAAGPWGRIPAWGVATVLESRSEHLRKGERFFGLVPMSSHLVVSPVPTREGFRDNSVHRQDANPIYNRYTRVTGRADDDLERETALRPMFLTSFVLARTLKPATGDHMVVTSASSKAGLGLAHLLHREAKVSVTGLTASNHVEFVAASGCFDEVLSYDDLDGLARTASTMVVDFAGQPALVEQLQHRLGDRLTDLVRVGQTHWDARPAGMGDLGGDASFFFAPAYLQQLVVAWGAGDFERRFADEFGGFLTAIRGWLRAVHHDGGRGMTSAYQQLLDGSTDPRNITIVRPGHAERMPPDVAPAQWTVVDEGWGWRAVDFATLSEPANCREYVAVHQLLGVGAGDRVLDVACGSGLAVELCAARGAAVAGLDASRRLIAIARDRSPQADLQVGDMHALPWADNTFDAVTSFRGIWGTTPDAVAEVRRVLRPGGRMGLTVWGHIKASPGAWALSPFTLAAPDKVANQAAMVKLGRPGAGEELLTGWGFENVERHEISFAWEFADPEHYARSIASTGPAYEAIQTVGEQAFLDHARQVAVGRLRDGLPLRAVILVVGYIATKPLAAAAAHDNEPPGHFLTAAPASTAAARLRQDDLNELGYVMNTSRLWGHMPATVDGLFDLLGHCVKHGRLDMRTRAILVAATASTLGDSYCSLAWGAKLSTAADAELAAAVLAGGDSALTPQEQALAAWARMITRDPNSTTAADVTVLRQAGLDDDQIMAITVFVALRVAFSTVNDALGAVPDAELIASVPSPVADVVTWGRR